VGARAKNERYTQKKESLILLVYIGEAQNFSPRNVLRQIDVIKGKSSYTFILLSLYQEVKI